VDKKNELFFAFLSFFSMLDTLRRLLLKELCHNVANLLALGRKNKRVCFVLLSFFRNFAPANNIIR